MQEDEMKIQELTRKELYSRKLRVVGLLLLATALIGLGCFFTHKPAKTEFKVLDTLAWEAQALDEDKTGSRLNLPTEDYQEIKNYFKNYPGLSFPPSIFNPNIIDQGWKFTGVALIEYDSVQISCIVLEQIISGQKLYHFSIPSHLKELPPSNLGNLNEFYYQTYASEHFNIVAWESSPNILSLLMGRLDSKNLAIFAKTNTFPPLPAL